MEVAGIQIEFIDFAAADGVPSDFDGRKFGGAFKDARFALLMELAEIVTDVADKERLEIFCAPDERQQRIDLFAVGVQ